MSTQLVHIGDLHAAPGPRNADRYATLDQIVAHGLSLPRLGAFVWTGDLFDGPSTPEDRNAIDARLKRMAAAAPVVILEGNHDRPGDLRDFANLAGAHPIYVIDRETGPQVLHLKLATWEQAAFFCLPYVFRQGLVGAHVAPDDIIVTAQQLLEPIFMAAAAELESARDAGHIPAFFFHQNIVGAITSAGQPNVGKEIELTFDLLERLGSIYKGGGHIHRPQQISGAWFAGSTARKDYGEVEEKRFLVVEFFTPDEIAAGVQHEGYGFLQSHSGHWHGYSVESVPLGIPPMFRIRGLLDREGFEFEFEPDDPEEYQAECLRRMEASDWQGCDVRVTYSYLASDRPVINEQIIHELFASALRLKVIGVVVPDREVRSVKVATAKTLVDKLAAMRPEGVLAETLAHKVTALEQFPREVVLDQVRGYLTQLEAGEREAEAVAS